MPQPERAIAMEMSIKICECIRNILPPNDRPGGRDMPGNLLTYPYGYKLRDLPRVEFRGVYPVGHPQFLLIHSGQRALPLHFLPTTLPDHVKAMPWVADVFSHPSSKCNVVRYESGI